MGTKLAAIRRLSYEMNINNLKPENIQFLTKILYSARNYPNTDFIEKELDYILQVCISEDEKFGNKLNPNPNEVMQAKFVTWNQINSMNPVSLTPWFRMIIENGLLEAMFHEEVDSPRSRVMEIEADRIYDFGYQEEI